MICAAYLYIYIYKYILYIWYIYIYYTYTYFKANKWGLLLSCTVGKHVNQLLQSLCFLSYWPKTDMLHYLACWNSTRMVQETRTLCMSSLCRKHLATCKRLRCSRITDPSREAGEFWIESLSGEFWPILCTSGSCPYPLPCALGRKMPPQARCSKTPLDQLTLCLVVFYVDISKETKKRR